MSSSKKTVISVHWHYPTEHVHVTDHIDFQIIRNAESAWERLLEEFSSRQPRYLRTALMTVVKLLRRHGVRMTSKKLLRSATLPGEELDESAMKKVLSAAFKEKALTKKGRKGYGLPFWDMQETGHD